MKPDEMRIHIDVLERQIREYLARQRAIQKVVDDQSHDSVLNLPVGTSEPYLKKAIKRLTHVVLIGEDLGNE